MRDFKPTVILALLTITVALIAAAVVVDHKLDRIEERLTALEA